MKKEKIGIAFTSRNRSHVLDVCLEGCQGHLNTDKYDYEFWVIDDASDHPERSNYEEILAKYPHVKYHKNEERLGIAKSKNQCLKRVKNCDYIFLFDDDCFFYKDGWEDFFIDHHKRTGIHHFSYQTDAGWLGLYDVKDNINQFHNGAGVMLFITKEVIQKVGGYDNRMTYYGYEHSNYQFRIFDAGLMNGYARYSCPVGASEYIFSLDLDMNCGGKLVPHRPDFHQGKYEFSSSMEGEQDKIQQYINENSRFLMGGSIFKEIE